MLGYAAQRLLGVLAILAAMSFLIFAATQLLPGDVAHVILGQFATNEQIAQVQQSLGLNDPWWQQYGRWVLMQRPIAPEVLQALGRSALLAGSAFGFVVLAGLWLGIHSATHVGRWSDRLLTLAQYF